MGLRKIGLMNLVVSTRNIAQDQILVDLRVGDTNHMALFLTIQHEMPEIKQRNVEGIGVLNKKVKK